MLPDISVSEQAEWSMTDGNIEKGGTNLAHSLSLAVKAYRP